MISAVARENDRTFTNVSVEYNGRPAELDNLIVNENGVFIIEVKYYSGVLYGNEDDYEWSKYHVSSGGNTYYKTVKNPIKQVKREIYILARFLESRGFPVWVEGRAMIFGADSPVFSRYILSNGYDIDRFIHTAGKQKLSKDKVDSIARIFANKN